MEKHKEEIKLNVLGQSLAVGITAGLIVLSYRLVLGYAGTWLKAILAYAKESPIRMAGWFVALLIMATIVGRLLKYEPMISGSGIPQLEGEMENKMEQTWWKVLPAKYIGGFLSLLAGLSLGREGPSIQLGAMTGKGLARVLKRDKEDEKVMLTCGASAGLSAAFHAPLAGVMFALEEVHKKFSVIVLISAMIASISADYIASCIIGGAPVFQFEVGNALPYEYYWMLILLGAILGVLGAFYNWTTMKVKALFAKPRCLNETTRLFIPFMIAGVLGFTRPELLGSGHELIEALTGKELLLGAAAAILAAKFLFSIISFGSGAPGGIFFPLLVLGAFIGGVFALACVQYLGLDPGYVNNFVVLAMAGYFTAIVRAPMTGLILIFEMTGSVSQMLSLAVVALAAYIVATWLKSKPIYDSLLESQLSTMEKGMKKSA